MRLTGGELSWDAPLSCDVEIEDNPVIAELLGPDGCPLVQWRERATVTFGFQPRG